MDARKYSVPTDSRFVSIEFPGPVRSIKRALQSVGGVDAVSKCLAVDNANAEANAIELNLNGKNRFHHPVPANVLDSGNVVLKVTRRRRKRPKLDEDGGLVEEGVFTVEPVGVVGKTVKFRGIADFQYTTETSPDDPMIEMADAIRDLDVSAIQSFAFPPPDEEYTSPSVYLPLPAFTRYSIPHGYAYNPAAGSVRVKATRSGTGEDYERLINVSRNKASPMMVITFADPAVPQGPSQDLISQRKPQTDPTEESLREIINKERPVWTRTALLNQLHPEEKRVAQNHKHVVSLIGWSFADGPFRDLVIRFGYDPRTDAESRFYQNITLRNVSNTRTKRKVVTANVGGASDAKGKGKDASTHMEHIFDGRNIHSPVGNFQLKDMTDTLLRSLITAPRGVMATCDDTEDHWGWWDRDYFDQIRNVLRRKFLGVLNGAVVADTECEDLLGDPKLQTRPGPKGSKAKLGARRGSDSRTGSGSGTDGEGEEEGSGSELNGEDEGDEDESEGGDSGSDQNGAQASGSKSAAGGAALGKKPKPAYRKPPKAPGEGTGKKKGAQAKKPAS